MRRKDSFPIRRVEKAANQPIQWLLTMLSFIILPLLTTAQIPTPASQQTNKVLLLGGYAHIGNGEVIGNSVIAFENGKLTIVTDAATVKFNTADYDEVVNLEGQHVYPGFIAPNSTLGLVEIGAVRATRDFTDVGTFKPHIRSLIAYNTESKITSTVRTNGVLLAQVTPRGGIISGTSSVMQLDGWNWEDAVHTADDGIHLNWPTYFVANPNGSKPEEVAKRKTQRQQQIESIYSFFKDAKAYSEIKNHTDKNLQLEAMRGIFDTIKNVYIHADFIKELEEAINFTRDLGIPKAAIVGGYDSWRVTEMLKENNIPVILRRVHSLPIHPEDDVDLPYKTPYLLQKAGVLFCLNNSGSMEAMGTRNLPFYAGTAIAYGLKREEGVAAITLNAAKILGIEKQTGSLEAGKDATLFISTGDALDMRTNNVIHAYIKGGKLELTNHQIHLYEKYSKKYE